MGVGAQWMKAWQWLWQRLYHWLTQRLKLKLPRFDGHLTL